MILRFKKSHQKLAHLEWQEWNCEPFKIISLKPGYYQAYFINEETASLVESPPNLAECFGCRAETCNGLHKAWNNYDAAVESCIRYKAAKVF